MHVTWWSVVAVVLFIWAAVSDCISSPRNARRLSDVLQGGTGSHAEAFATQHRSYRRKMWWQVPIGVILVLLGIDGGFRGDWSGNVVPIAMGLWLLTSGVVGFVCLRILGPPQQTVDS
jgi:hypothetical protein